MFEKDENVHFYRYKYICDMLPKIEKEIQKVDDRIRKSIKRINAPMPDSVTRTEVEISFDQRENILEQLDGLDKKIEYFLQIAEQKGEEGLIEESEALS